MIVSCQFTYDLLFLRIRGSSKANLYYTRDITSKPVTSGGGRLCGLAIMQHIFKETSKRCRAVGDTASNLSGPGIEPQTPVR